jgi:hypothetical protein
MKKSCGKGESKKHERTESKRERIAEYGKKAVMKKTLSKKKK